MPDFKKPRHNKERSGGFSRPERPSFSGGFSSRRPPSRDSRDSETFKANCSKCGNSCEVPFRPNGKKPVYCRDCFVRDDSRPAGNSYEKRSFGSDRAPARQTPAEDPRIGQIQKELSAVHAKLDTLIESLQGSAYASIIATATEREDKPVKKAPAKKVAKKKTSK